MTIQCSCNAFVQVSGPGMWRCPSCGVLHDAVEGSVVPPAAPQAQGMASEPPLKEVLWVSASGKEYPDTIGVEIDPNDRLGDFVITDAGTRIKPKGFRLP